MIGTTVPISLNGNVFTLVLKLLYSMMLYFPKAHALHEPYSPSAAYEKRQPPHRPQDEAFRKKI